ncbi:MAG: hypothetical protein HKL99_08835 [Burkholderiales bacterium]|nr:hypothetical protein [Burkholderiales bacterium]
MTVWSELQRCIGLRMQEAVQSGLSLASWLRSLEQVRPLDVVYGTKGGRARATFVPEAVCDHSGRLVRINPTDCTVPSAFDVGLPLGALAALQGMASALEAL